MNAFWFISVSVILFVVLCFTVFLMLNRLFRDFKLQPIWFKLAVVFGISHFSLFSISTMLLIRKVSAVPMADKYPAPVFMNFSLAYVLYMLIASLQYCIWGYLIGRIIDFIKTKK